MQVPADPSCARITSDLPFISRMGSCRAGRALAIAHIRKNRLFRPTPVGPIHFRNKRRIEIRSNGRISEIPSPRKLEFALQDVLSFPLDLFCAPLAVQVYERRVAQAGKEQRARTGRGEHHASELPL